MRHVHHRLQSGLLAIAAGVVVLAFALTTGQTTASATGRLLGLGDDKSATGRCTTTVTGQNNAVINVPGGQTFCLERLTQTGAVNVAPGGSLEVRDSNITGAITLPRSHRERGGEVGTPPAGFGTVRVCRGSTVLRQEP